MRLRARLFGLDATPARLGEDWQLLDPAEQARAAQFRFDRDRRRFIVRRAALRRTLAAETGEAPRAVRYLPDAFGKLALAGGGGPAFSVSRSRETALIVTGGAARIGCDLEWRDPALASPAIARRFFAPDEIAALEALPPEAWLSGFFDCWTRKEAYVKALGRGLSHPLDSFTVSVAERAALLVAEPGFAIASASPLPALHVAVVATGGAIALDWISAAAAIAA
jgi:4'-phosphopantetheinyl transferase